MEERKRRKYSSWIEDHGRGIAYALAISGVVALVALLLFLFVPRSIDATVDGFSWKRVVPIERWATVMEEDWNIPARGRYVSQRQAIHHYEKVLSHYERKCVQVPEQVQTGTEEYKCGTRDLGNGYFEDIMCTRPKFTTRYRTECNMEPVYRDDPVYRTKYTYEIERWILDHDEVVVGNDKEPRWPEIELREDQREKASGELQGTLCLLRGRREGYARRVGVVRQLAGDRDRDELYLASEQGRAREYRVVPGSRSSRVTKEREARRDV
jgi:hypothetical protein